MVSVSKIDLPTIIFPYWFEHFTWALPNCPKLRNDNIVIIND